MVSVNTRQVLLIIGNDIFARGVYVMYLLRAKLYSLEVLPFNY